MNKSSNILSSYFWFWNRISCLILTKFLSSSTTSTAAGARESAKFDEMIASAAMDADATTTKEDAGNEAAPASADDASAPAASPDAGAVDKDDSKPSSEEK